jgi:hypothetical protein
MFNRTTMEKATQAAITLPDQIAGMRTDLAVQTAAMLRMSKAMELRDAAKKELPIFLDLTLAQPSTSIGDTLNIVDGWISAAGPQCFVVHVGEMGVFFVHWYTGGFDKILPLSPEYPMPLGRGVRIWIEQVNAPDVDFFVKLVAFPVRSPHAEG